MKMKRNHKNTKQILLLYVHNNANKAVIHSHIKCWCHHALTDERSWLLIFLYTFTLWYVIHPNKSYTVVQVCCPFWQVLHYTVACWSYTSYLVVFYPSWQVLHCGVILLPDHTGVCCQSSLQDWTYTAVQHHIVVVIFWLVMLSFDY